MKYKLTKGVVGSIWRISVRKFGFWCIIDRMTVFNPTEENLKKEFRAWCKGEHRPTKLIMEVDYEYDK